MKIKLILLFIINFFWISFLSADEISELLQDAKNKLKEGNYNQAIEGFKKVIDKDSKNFDGWIGLGTAYYNTDDFDAAIKSFNKALEIKDDVEIRKILASIYIWQKSYENALAEYEKVLKVEDTSENRLAIARLNSCLQRYGTSLSEYNKILEKDKENITAQKEKAIILTHLGNYNEAIDNFKKVIEKDSTQDDAYFGLGQLYYLKGKWGKAKDFLKTSLIINPYNKDASSILSVIKEAFSPSISLSYTTSNESDYFKRDKQEIGLDFYLNTETMMSIDYANLKISDEKLGRCVNSKRISTSVYFMFPPLYLLTSYTSSNYLGFRDNSSDYSYYLYYGGSKIKGLLNFARTYLTEDIYSLATIKRGMYSDSWTTSLSYSSENKKTSIGADYIQSSYSDDNKRYYSSLWTNMKFLDDPLLELRLKYNYDIFNKSSLYYYTSNGTASFSSGLHIEQRISEPFSYVFDGFYTQFSSAGYFKERYATSLNVSFNYQAAKKTSILSYSAYKCENYSLDGLNISFSHRF